MALKPLLLLVFGGLATDALRAAAALVVATIILAVITLTTVLALPFGLIIGGHPTRSVPTTGGTINTSSAAAGARIVQVALTAIGTPYVWGGTDPATGVDCSGLVQWAYRQVGVDLPRTAQAQFDTTVRVPTSELQPGDLVFFQICCQPPDVITHVGIYIGGGQMIHAPTEGDVVRITSIDTPYWQEHFAGAGRPGR